MKINPKIKIEIAKAILREARPGFDARYQPRAYVVDGEKVVCAAPNRPWDPWPDNAEVISVTDLVYEVGGAQGEGVDFSLEVEIADDEMEEALDFVMAYVPTEYPTNDERK